MTWENFNSQRIIKKAKFIYFNFLANNSAKGDPIGVVLNKQTLCGKVIFRKPLLLPNEYYLPIKFLDKQKKKYKNKK